MKAFEIISELDLGFQHFESNATDMRYGTLNDAKLALYELGKKMNEHDSYRILEANEGHIIAEMLLNGEVIAVQNLTIVIVKK